MLQSKTVLHSVLGVGAGAPKAAPNAALFKNEAISVWVVLQYSIPVGPTYDGAVVYSLCQKEKVSRQVKRS